MIREVVKIDEELCDGCGLCVPGCHEGALQIIDNKARLISDLMCDGLGACIGHCPQGAITIEKREAEPYNETKVMEIMAAKGKNTVVAHLMHLKEHREFDYLKEGIDYLKTRSENLEFSLKDVLTAVRGDENPENLKPAAHNHGRGCPGSQTMSFNPKGGLAFAESSETPVLSELRQWPVQLHLVNPNAPYYHNTDVVIAADCTAYAIGDFHRRFMKGKSLAIACPKLDSNLEVYVKKIRVMIEEAHVNTISVIIMKVPCCQGLLQMVQQALQNSSRKVPVKAVVVGIEGEILKEEWV
jgi:NAD-dependent dihydropyrimidine dehydrogenase PreA subunit